MNQATGRGPDVAFANLLASFSHPSSAGSISLHYLLYGFEATPGERKNASFFRDTTAYPVFPPPGIRFREKTHDPHRWPARVCRKTIDIPFAIRLKSTYFCIIFVIQDRWERLREISGGASASRRAGRTLFWESAHETEAAPAVGPSWIPARGCARCSWRRSLSFLYRCWPVSWVSRTTRRAMTEVRPASFSGRKSFWYWASTPRHRSGTGRGTARK